MVGVHPDNCAEQASEGEPGENEDDRAENVADFAVALAALAKLADCRVPLHREEPWLAAAVPRRFRWTEGSIVSVCRNIFPMHILAWRPCA